MPPSKQLLDRRRDDSPSHKDRVETWEREYRHIHSIPSSTRSYPSKAVLIAEALVDFGKIKRILDAGCGNGRNAVHFAKKGFQVIAADFSPAALDFVSNAARDSGNIERLHPIRIDLNRTFPFIDETFGFCLDSYVSCHFTDRSTFDSYWRELTRVTRTGGYIFSSMFSVDDQYYDELSGGLNSRIVTDLHNGITKKLYAEGEFKSLFPPSLSLIHFLKYQFIDRVIGKDYRRSLLLALLRKDMSKSQ